ncbi:metallophosphoesterase [Pseudomonas sp. BP8]|uniref:metallophosphoesterase n=1 Tax=Pseudomonas sp. BP8 TaxID=2817864 RepID=UPI001AE2E1C1|nr:putative MPP superfamily phosphohydrolase [Pseudomonas sp. BP8]HDS1733318.1 metallophosphoesterase [Pseudomonas putida]
MFHVYTLAGALYLIWRFVLPLPIAKTWCVIGAMVLLGVSQYHALQILTFGTMFSPEMPRILVILLGWAFCTFVLLAVFTLLLDVCNLVIKAIRSARSLATARNRLGAAAFAVLLSGYGVHQAIQVPPIKRVSVEIPNLPRGLDGMRIVQLSDLHISRLFDAPWTEDVVAKTNALNADLVVITGDLIDGTPEARQRDVKALGGLRAELGVIAIPGNHEYYFQEGRWRQIFEQLGMKVLVNEHAIVARNQTQLAVAGVTDEVASNYRGAAPDLGQAITGIPERTPIVLLKHRPQSARESAEAGVSLQLSGHTHGGMILGLNHIARYANDGYISGMYQVGSMTLYVSNGTALWNGFPIRLGIPPEITELTLHSSQQP